MKAAIGSSTFLVDSRKDERYNGLVQEPRPAKRLGHIPGAKCIPIPNVTNGSYFKPAEEIKQYVTSRDNDETFLRHILSKGVLGGRY